MFLSARVLYAHNKYRLICDQLKTLIPNLKCLLIISHNYIAYKYRK